MSTMTDTAPLYTGRFGEIHDKYYSINPFYAPNDYRYRHYNQTRIRTLALRFRQRPSACANIGARRRRELRYAQVLIGPLELDGLTAKECAVSTTAPSILRRSWCWRRRSTKPG